VPVRTRIWHGDPKAAIRHALKQIFGPPDVPKHLASDKALLLELQKTTRANCYWMCHLTLRIRHSPPCTTTATTILRIFQASHS